MSNILSAPLNDAYEQDPVCRICSFIPLCRSKNRLNQENLATKSKTKQDYPLKSGRYLIQPEDSLLYFYALRQGSCKQYTLTSTGKERIIDFYLPGEIIGLDALYQRKFHHFIAALENTIICRITFAEISKIILAEPKLNFYLLELLSKKLLLRSIIHQHQSAEERLLSFLVNIAERYQKLASTNSFKLSMSRHDIGNYLNLTTETVSRTFTKLKQKGVLKVNKKYLHLD